MRAHNNMLTVPNEITELNSILDIEDEEERWTALQEFQPKIDKYRQGETQGGRATHAAELVYGVRKTPADTLILLPRETAERFAAVHRAIARAKTWSEFLSLIPPSAVADVVEGFVDMDEGIPSASDAFAPELLVGYEDGDWPGRPEQIMLEILPRDIAREFGIKATSVLNGDFIQVDASRTDEVIARLRSRGYICRHDQALIARACRR